MKNKWKFGFFALLTLDCMVLLLIFAYTKQETDRSILYSYIHYEISQYQQGIDSVIDFSKIPTVSWERMYIFGPYPSCKAINAVLETPVFWLECKRRNIESMEYGSLLIFKNNYFDVKYIIYDGIYVDSVNVEGFTYEDAKFVLDDRGRFIWVGSN